MIEIGKMYRNEVKVEQNTYLLMESLSYEAFGQVFKGQNKETSQIVAIKIQVFINQHELMMLNKMKGKNFKNLVNILNLEQIGEKICIVMEYCKESLFERILNERTINGDEVRFIMKEIGNGIKEIHDLGYAHRNIKPENVLIFQKTENGITQDLYKICDFGTTKDINMLLTQQIGTAYYLAPEQVNGSNKYSEKVDIWAFGAMIYELLTGSPMFNGYSEEYVYSKIKLITQEQIDERIGKNLKIDKKNSTLLLNMLQIDINKRFDIGQIISELRGKSQTITKEQKGKGETKVNPIQLHVKNPQQFLCGLKNPNNFQKHINQQTQVNGNNIAQNPKILMPAQQQQNIDENFQRGRLGNNVMKDLQFHQPLQINHDIDRSFQRGMQAEKVKPNENQIHSHSPLNNKVKLKIISIRENQPSIQKIQKDFQQQQQFSPLNNGSNQINGSRVKIEFNLSVTPNRIQNNNFQHQNQQRFQIQGNFNPQNMMQNVNFGKQCEQSPQQKIPNQFQYFYNYTKFYEAGNLNQYR